VQQRQIALKHVHEALRLAPGNAPALALLALLQSPTQSLTLQALRQPSLESRQWEGLKPRGLHRRELPHKRKNADVYRARRGSAQMVMGLQLHFQGLKQHLYGLVRVVLSTQSIAEALWVFVSV